MSENNQSGGKKNRSYRMPIGMCIGLAIGAAVGAATHNLGTWIPIGLCLGLALGYQNTKENGNGTDDQQQASK